MAVNGVNPNIPINKPKNKPVVAPSSQELAPQDQVSLSFNVNLPPEKVVKNDNHSTFLHFLMLFFI